MKARKLLAELLQGRLTDWRLASAISTEEFLQAVAEEGVAVLAHERLVISAFGDCPPALSDQVAKMAREETIRSLLLAAEGRLVLASLAQIALTALLLKGSALAYWLYPEPHFRDCADIDLLLSSREHVERAAEQLKILGYARRERDLPGNLTTCEMTCFRSVAGKEIEVDLHWDIGGAPVYGGRVGVEELFASAIPLPKLSPLARAPEPAHALLHAAMHRVLNLHLVGDRLKWLYDIRLLSRHFSATDWQRLLAISEQQGLAGTCMASLEAATEIGAIIPVPIRHELLRLQALEVLDVQRMTQWRYIQRMNLQALPDWQTRLRWIWQRLWPAPGYLQDMYGEQGNRFVRLGRYLWHGLDKFRR